MSAAIEQVEDALLKRLGRAKDVAKAIQGDKCDQDLLVKNVCQWDRSFVILEDAVRKTQLSWPDAITAAIEDLKTRRPAPLFAS